MNAKIKKLYSDYCGIEQKIRNELDNLGKDECNCDDVEEITLVWGDDMGIERRCGNCGGVIWDREII